MDSLQIEFFKKKLNRHLKQNVELVITENRSTMLNVLRKSTDAAKISLHRMFLDAPEEVISAIARYVRGTRKERQEKESLIRSYIQTNLSRFNYSHLLNKQKLTTKGHYYDLALIYQNLNHEYFDGKLQLQITWFGKEKKKARSRIVFGQYHDHLKLIKIHRRLDDPFFPNFFVNFVVYHEMVHDVARGYVNEKGRYCIHNEEFKRKERQFADFERAVAWEKKHKKDFFE